MARAKRTDRTAARRRRRADQAALAGDPADVTEAGAASGRTDTAAKATAAKPAERPSIVAALKGAIRPLDLKGDLRNIKVVIVNWGFLAAIAGSAALAAWFVIAYNGAVEAIPAGSMTTDQFQSIIEPNSLPYMLYTMAMQPPAVIGAFLVGFTAVRASWLGGFLYGIAVVIMAVVVVQFPAGRLLAMTQDGTEAAASSVIVAQAAWSPVGAALFASAAAWYRRFLDLANPNRNQKQQQKPQKPQGRGDMKPSRL